MMRTMRTSALAGLLLFLTMLSSMAAAFQHHHRHHHAPSHTPSSLRPTTRRRAAVVRRIGNLFDGLLGGGGKKKAEISDAEAREKYGVQLPKYDAVPREGYELRRYQPMSIVECDYVARPEGYEMLGGYSGGGENALGLPMPQTCPCVMSPCLEPKTMFYVLPSPHTPLNPSDPITPPPAPLSDAVRLRTVDGLAVAVIKFSGYATPDVVFSKRDECKSLLARDGTPYDADDADARLMIAQYNELFSLPWNRDNEVWLPIPEFPAAEAEAAAAAAAAA